MSKSNIKHYIGVISITVGEYQSFSAIRFKTSGRPDNYLDKVAKNWYGSKPKKSSKGYLFDCGEVLVCGDGAKEISQSVFNDISGIIHQH